MFKSVLNALSSAIGLKESKAISLTYDEATKRITEAECRRLQEAFKRVVTSNAISKQTFCHEVLSLVPQLIAERVYITCGGSSKGLIFKDLVCSLVILTKGTLEEKIRFIFAVYASDTLIHKDEFIRFISEVEECPTPENLAQLFLMGNSVEFEAFCRWVIDPRNRNSTTIISWLIGNDSGPACGNKSFNLSDDHETPTFYQVSIAGVTHLSEEDITELEKRYWQLQANSHTGKVDVATLLPLISPPLPESIVQGFFSAIDENRDGHIDFKEMACGISAAARGPIAERQKFCFKIFDQDKDSVLSLTEQKNMVSIMKNVLLQDLTDSPKDDILMIVTREDDDLVNELQSNVSTGANSMTLEEYLVWSLSNPLPEKFLVLVYQVCQVVLGLKPQDPCEEFDVVTAWLNREAMQAGQTWYLISTEWWNSWLHYVSSSALCPLSNSDSGVCSITGSVASQSNSIVGFSDTNTGSGSSTTSSSKSSSSRCWPKKSNVESSVAMDTSQNVVVTAMSAIDSEVDVDNKSTLNSQAKFTSSLSLVTMDSSRSTCSSSPSPVNSPSSIRKNLSGTSWNGKARKPGAIDNTHLLSSMSYGKVPSLTNEGGRLRKDVEEGRDFKKVPFAIWNALHQWYGGQIPLPRQVIDTEKSLELELYPLTLLLYRHQVINTANKPNSVNNAPWTGMYGAAALSTTMSYVQNHNLYPPKRILSFVLSFSRKTRLGTVWQFICQKLRLSMHDTRLDLLTSEDLQFHLVLDEEGLTLEELNLADLSAILIETRNKDQTWPEEIGSLALANNSHDSKFNRQSSTNPVEKGLTGLNNLGNTCFMNSALQCVSNTKPLTLYFTKKMHMYELNRTNPLGMKGHIAKRYGDLITDIWSGTVKTIAPFKLRWTIGKYAPRFSGFQQNDSQELLAFLLDGLHEDLNRVAEKPYVELKDSDNRPDVVCAQEAWENHLLRNKSIVVDLFHGQLKSSVRCKECNQESVRFDPFNYLSLPLPMESQIRIEFKVFFSDGSTPIRYGLLASMDERIIDVKNRLSELTEPKLEPDSLLLAEIRQSRIVHIFSDYQKIKGVFVNRPIYVYQITANFTVQYDSQIQRIMSSAKNQSSPLLRVPVENGSTMGHSRQSSFSSCGSTSMQTSLSDVQLNNSDNVIIVVHRKMIRQESYFLATQKSRPVLFGLPLVVPFVTGMTHFDLYKRVWSLVARLVSPLPPTEASNTYNHAQDCDDSLGYEYPFVLRIVMKDAELSCGRCQWYCFCRGCSILCTEEILDKLNLNQICVAIDWDPTALHLRYQTTQELEHIDHPSVAEAIKKQTESVAFLSCLESFTKEEELNEEEKYNCSKCGGHQLASKKLQIWRLPPILIVHLKRFQLVQGRWTKSHKVVDFPFTNFDPTSFLADVPRKTIEAELGNGAPNGDSDLSDLYPLQDFHQHRLLSDINPFQLDYRLYAVVNHSGLMGAGHYISYAKGVNGKWFCFNDSSCKEVLEDQIETNTAYMLFYERTGLDCNAYLPRIDPKTVPITNDDELDQEENELKKVCTLF